MPTSATSALILTTIPIIIKIIILFWKMKVHQRLQNNAIRKQTKKMNNRNKFLEITIFFQKKKRIQLNSNSNQFYKPIIRNSPKEKTN